jgi:hypothetical protein
VSKTYKAVFTCAVTRERLVWYVSSRQEAKKHLRNHIGSNGKKAHSVYRNNPWTLEIKPMFQSAHDVHYDAVTSWSGL